MIWLIVLGGVAIVLLMRGAASAASIAPTVGDMVIPPPPDITSTGWWGNVPDLRVNMPILGLPTGGTHDRTQAIAQAISVAEGYLVTGSIPNRRNNPGNLKDSSGNIATYSTPDDGWFALYRQVDLILDGNSSYYNPSMSILEIASIWTGNDNPEAWASIVASRLGTSTQTALENV